MSPGTSSVDEPGPSGGSPPARREASGGSSPPRLVATRQRSHTMGEATPPRLPLYKMRSPEAPLATAAVASAGTTPTPPRSDSSTAATTPERARTPLGKLKGLFRRGTSSGSLSMPKKGKSKEPSPRVSDKERVVLDPVRALSLTGGSGSSFDDEGQESSEDDDKIVFHLERDAE